MKKYESMFVVHVRYDINSDQYNDASDIHVYIQNKVNEYLRARMALDMESYPTSVFVSTNQEVENADRQMGLKARVTFATTVDSVMSDASENRRSPNVWFLGRLASAAHMAREWVAYGRTIGGNNELAARARSFDTQEAGSDSIQLPTLPYNTMRLIFNRARENFYTDNNKRWHQSIKESTVDVLEGLFEDGLPVDRELTQNELGNYAEPF